MEKVFYSYSTLKYYLTHSREKNIEITVIQDFEKTMSKIGTTEYKWFKNQLKERNITIKVKKI